VEESFSLLACTTSVARTGQEVVVSSAVVMLCVKQKVGCPEDALERNPSHGAAFTTPHHTSAADGQTEALFERGHDRLKVELTFSEIYGNSPFLCSSFIRMAGGVCMCVCVCVAVLDGWFKQPHLAPG